MIRSAIIFESTFISAYDNGAINHNVRGQINIVVNAGNFLMNEQMYHNFWWYRCDLFVVMSVPGRLTTNQCIEIIRHL